MWTPVWILGTLALAVYVLDTVRLRRHERKLFERIREGRRIAAEQDAP